MLFCRFDPNNSKYGPMGVKYPDFDQNYPKCWYYANNLDHLILYSNHKIQLRQSMWYFIKNNCTTAADNYIYGYIYMGDQMPKVQPKRTPTIGIRQITWTIWLCKVTTNYIQDKAWWDFSKLIAKLCGKTHIWSPQGVKYSKTTANIDNIQITSQFELFDQAM